MPRVPSVLVLFVLFAAGPAAADVVVLDNGNRIEGKVEVEGETVTVELPGGRIEIDRARIVEIVRSQTPEERFDGFFASLDPKDAEGLFALAEWARERDLADRSRRAYEGVLAAASDHEGARRALGYFRHEGRWLTEDEYMAAKGFVRREGKWVSPDEARRIEVEEAVLAERERWQEELARQGAEFAARERELLGRLAALQGEVASLRHELDRRPLVIRRIVRVPCLPHEHGPEGATHPGAPPAGPGR